MLIDSRPIYLFSTLSLFLYLVRFIICINHWFIYGDVPRFPTFIFGTFLLIVGFTIFLTGLI